LNARYAALKAISFSSSVKILRMADSLANMARGLGLSLH
jgi:hypothetical protein